MWWSEGLLSNKGRYTTMKSARLIAYERSQKLYIKNLKELQSLGYEFKQDYIDKLTKQRSKAPSEAQLKSYRELFNLKEMKAHATRTYTVSQLTGISNSYNLKEGEELKVEVANPKQLAGLVNEGLMNINEKRTHGISTRTPDYLPAFMAEMSGETEFEAGKRYTSPEGSFIIDEDWSGSYTDLAEHVSFTKIDIKNPTTKASFERLLTIPYISEGNEELFEKQWHEASAKTFIENKEDEIAKGKWTRAVTNPAFIRTVKDVLNQSHMWAIASKGLPYKDKKNIGTHERNYMTLVSLYEEVSSYGKETLLDQFKQLIDNEIDMDDIVRKVDEWLEEIYMEE